MILYNVTISIDPHIQDEWLNWMRQKHIPDVLETGCFVEARLSRVHGEEEGGVTYAVSYIAASEEKYNEYMESYAPQLQNEHSLKYQNQFAAFRTILTVIEEFRK